MENGKESFKSTDMSACVINWSGESDRRKLNLFGICMSIYVCACIYS